jgi:hypothetical protein
MLPHAQASGKLPLSAACNAPYVMIPSILANSANTTYSAALSWTPPMPRPPFV